MLLEKNVPVTKTDNFKKTTLRFCSLYDSSYITGEKGVCPNPNNDPIPSGVYRGGVIGVKFPPPLES